MTYIRQLKVPPDTDARKVAVWSEKNMDELLEYINDLESRVEALAAVNGATLDQVEQLAGQSDDGVSPFIVNKGFTSTSLTSSRSALSGFTISLSLSTSRLVVVNWEGFVQQSGATALDFSMWLSRRKAPSISYTDFRFKRPAIDAGSGKFLPLGITGALLLSEGEYDIAVETEIQSGGGSGVLYGAIQASVI